MLKTEAYFVIGLVLMLVQQLLVILSEVEEPCGETSGSFAGSFDFAQDDFAANSTARLIAAIMLSVRAIPLPAISNAVP